MLYNMIESIVTSSDYFNNSNILSDDLNELDINL